ncbi:MAG: trypsin-like peptidase domain-containing protein, partial [Gemmatimonadota bacterium]
ADGVESDTAPAELSRIFRRAARQTQPAVVHVEVEGVRRGGRVRVPEPFEGTPWEDFFRRFEREPRERPRTGSGSGLIFRPDGYILTNDHVVADAERVTVVLQDRREFSAEVVGRDPNTDVAVLEVEAEDLPVAELGDSDGIAVGDWVVALGYPLHLGSTATAGIVSAKGKAIGILSRNEEASAPLEHFIQTDAAINPGNSGGPLVGLDGRVIGMNTAIASPTGYYSGYGFAAPIGLVRRVADDLIRHGAVHRPKLGVAVQDVNPADAEVYRLDRPYGAEVVRVEQGGPAERAGLRLGDVIVAADGDPIESSGDLTARLARMQPGDEVALDVVRYGDRVRLTVELDAFEPTVATRRGAGDAEDGDASLLGFQATALTPTLARRLGIEPDDGGARRGSVVIARVHAGSPAARAGLAPGMLIERLDGRAIDDVDSFERAVSGIGPGDVVSLVVRLPDGTRTIVNYRVQG